MAGRHIPDDLILKEIILKRLNLMTKTDATRFRAVCKSWRSSIPRIERNPLLLPYRFQIGNEWLFLFPSESIVHHIAPPSDDPSTPKQRGWLIRLDRDGKLLHPLSQTYYRRSTPFLPKVLNTLNSLDFRISELARTYCSVQWGHWSKIVALNPDSPTFLLLRTKILYHGQIALHSNGIVKLQILKNQNSSIPDIDDVIIHQGKFYAVSHFGEIIVADSSGNVKSVTSLPCSVINTECYRWKMYLVESVGEVLLVQRQGPRFVPKGDLEDFVLEKNLKFQVCKLDEVGKRWIKMSASDLSDRILFLADDMISFSVSAKDFPGCRGSCIYFSYKHKDYKRNWSVQNIFSEIGVFNLYSKRAYQLGSYPTSANIFMPPQHDGGDD